MEQMENYIRIKGAMPLGPLIQYTNMTLDEQGQPQLQIKMIRQCNNYIHSVEAPYQMEAILRVKNCMYVRYTGPEDKLKFAYDKINLIAFEEDTIVADVFMPKAEEAD